MKKLLLAVWLAVTLSMVAYAATITAPSSFVISDPTTTTLTLNWTLGATGADSVNIIRISGSDTLFSYGDMSNTQTETTLVGLTPHTQYILGLRIRRGDSTAVSNLDTMYTAWPIVEMFRNILSSTMMSGARSWRASNIFYDSLYVADAAGLDSTYVYWNKAYTAIQAYVDGHADSSKVKLLIFNGHAEETNVLRETTNTNTGQWGFNFAASDSVNITVPGWTEPHLLDVDLSDHFYIRADGQTDNGHGTKVLIRLYRRDD